MVSENIEVFYSSLPTNGPLQCCIVNGIGGTSCSAPLWAGFAALANQQAAATGHNPVGLINVAATSIGNGPSYTNCFHDITSGNSTNTNPVGTTNAYGNITIANDFQAAPGYDLCTGWGSPNGTNLINALLAFDSVVWVDFNYTGKAQNGTYDNPFTTLAQGVSAVPVGGNILIRTTGSTPVTPFINKAMKIGAYGGTVTIGN
jgi:subtilase family serine protease